MKKFMVLSCMLVSMSMINAMDGDIKGGKAEAPKPPYRYSVEDFYFPGGSFTCAQQRFAIFQAAQAQKNIETNISPKTERTQS